MKKFNRYQKQHTDLLKIAYAWKSLMAVRLADAVKVFGVDANKLLSAMDNSGLNFAHPIRDEQHWLETYFLEHCNETTRFKYRLLIQDPAERGRLTDIVVELKRVDGYDGDYDRDGRVNMSIVDEIGHSDKIHMDWIKERARGLYDDTCGRGGGHHTRVGADTKAFIVVQAIEELLNREVLVPIQ